ncbi:MAG: hypothetical protein ACRDT7_17085 [Microbacterium sp.]
MISPTPSLRTPIKFRRSHRLGALTLVAASVILSGCSPAPSPAPTPTAAFASEEEAFAAAEASFEKYTRALNEVDTSNPETFEALFELSSGSVEKADRKNFSAMRAEGQIVNGDTRVTSFDGIRSDAPFDEVTAAVCLDVSDVTIVNPDGSSAVNMNRPSVYALEVTFLRDGTNALLVDSAASSDDVQCVTS